MISLQDIFTAQQRIKGIAKHTPTLYSPQLSQAMGTSVTLKLDMLQQVGAFKIRGAANKILNLSTEQKKQGVVTASTGNHGHAVAYVAYQLNIPATVCISELVPQNKVEALRQLGANVVVIGRSQDEAAEHAWQLQAGSGSTMIHPFDDPEIIAGQGTIGLELLQDLPEIDTALVPLSGGGLISGVGFVLKTVNPKIRVIGISMERGAVMYESLLAKRPLQMPEEATLADSLQGGIGLDNQYTFQMTQKVVDDVYLVTEAEIGKAIAFLCHTHKCIVEGAAAVGVAALLSGKVKNLGKYIALILTGNNVDMAQFWQVIQQYS